MESHMNHDGQQPFDHSENEERISDQDNSPLSSLPQPTQTYSNLSDGECTWRGSGEIANEGDQAERARQTLTVNTSAGLTRHTSSGTPSPSSRLTRIIEESRKLRAQIPAPVAYPPRRPRLGDFPPYTDYKLLEHTIDEPLRHCIVLLHDQGANEDSLEDLARRLKRSFPECLYLFLRGSEGVPGGNNGYTWTFRDEEEDAGFFKAVRRLLEDIILKGLVGSCNFEPRDIMLIGHGQGGSIGLAAAALWNAVEFGGVASIGDSSSAQSHWPAIDPASAIKTPILHMQASSASDSIAFMRRSFPWLELVDRRQSDDIVPSGEDRGELGSLQDFCLHRFRREQWEKQAAISFDGGGIRGYGSLLILKALMKEIADEEEELEPGIQSSFTPCIYRPKRTSMASDDSYLLDTASLKASKCDRDVSFSSRFFPCHYFDYFAGTSTGGLISIMLQRFRMSVDDCIREYESLGAKVFGSPRLSGFGLLRPKYDEKILETVIQDVTRRNARQKKIGDVDLGDVIYAMGRFDDDMCRCMVLATSDTAGASKAYPFRTYFTPRPKQHLSRANTLVQKSRGYGDPSNLRVWEVARATSAAPKYFKPIFIESGDGQTKHKFKDGGFGFNNPSHALYEDIRYKHGEDRIAMFVSIGTGESKLKHGSARNHVRNTIDDLKVATKMPAQVGQVHDQMTGLSSTEHGIRFPYYRFHGGTKLGAIALDEWKDHKLASKRKKSTQPGHKTIQDITDAVDEYLQNREVQKELRTVAKALVRRRRLRAKNLSEWGRYALFTEYRCDCKKSDERPFRTANDFRDHLRGKDHRILLDPEILEKEVLHGERCRWLYP